MRVQTIRRLGVSMIITVISIKGGVGKTTVSSSLAYSLAARGKRVLAVDMDLGAGGLDISLGCEGKVAPDITCYFRGESSLDETAVPTKYDGLFVALSPMDDIMSSYFSKEKEHPYSDITADRIKECLQEMRSSFDFVIFDMPAGGGYFQDMILSGGSDLAAVITTDGVFSIRAAEKVAADAAKRFSGEIRMIINGYSFYSPDYNFAGIVSLITTVKCRLLGIIPYDAETERFQRLGTPMSAVKKSPAGQAIINIAGRICGENVPVMDKLVRRRKRHLFF